MKPGEYEVHGYVFKYDFIHCDIDKKNLVYKLIYPELKKMYIGVTVDSNGDSRTLKERLNEHAQCAQKYRNSKNNSKKNTKKIPECDKALEECEYVKLEVLEECPNKIIAWNSEKRHTSAWANFIIQKLYNRKPIKEDKDIILKYMFNDKNLFY